MQANKGPFILLFLLCCVSCIDPFHPDIRESQESMVIHGVITDRPGLHRVTVTRSAPYNAPALEPVPGCVVRVEDDQGNVEVYWEEGTVETAGEYFAWLADPFLGVNKAYSLVVVTPDGEEYRSTYDTLLACPPIDTLYYELRSQGTADPDITHRGIRIFSDLEGTDHTSRNFRWKLEETWAYNSAHIANLFWDGYDLVKVMTDTINTCYMSGPVRELFSATSRFLTENSLRHNELNLVTNETPRLKLQYSVLVTQESLTDEIYDYWDRMKAQTGDAGGLYETQPSSTVGNLHNVNRPEEKVLGCFYATQQQSKRLNVREKWDFIVRGFTCELDTAANLEEVGTNFPYYIYSLDPLGVGPPYITGPLDCFDCQLLGGSNVKPDYW